MKKCKTIKIVTMIIILILTMLILETNVKAMSEIGNALNSANNFVSQGQSNIINYSAAYKVANYIYVLLMVIAIVVAVVKGAMIANKIILGSLNERADAKRMIIDYVFLVVALAVIPTVLKALINLIP
jgi:cytochrome b subunit of formate dehydrogenase